MKASIESVRQTWDRMRVDGVDLTQPLEWGFFFVDQASEPLRRVFAELESAGYVLEELARSDDGMWTLHVSKREVLEPERLHRRNLAFNELAEYCGADLYDGWDVTVPGRTDAHEA